MFLSCPHALRECNKGGDVCAKILLMHLQELAMSDVAHERRNEESRS